MKKNEDTVMKIVLVCIVLAIAAGGFLVVHNASKGEGKEYGYEDDIVEEEQPTVNIHNDYTAPAQIEPEALPDDLEATIGFSPKQLDRLSEHFVLAKYDISRDSIVYYYQAAETTSGERFNVICTKMSQEDYSSSIPAKNVQTSDYNGIELTYANRWLYSVPNDFQMIEPIQKGIENGTMEIEYGNTLEEVIKKDCVYWYDGGIKYEIQVRNQDLPQDMLIDIAKRIIDVK